MFGKDYVPVASLAPFRQSGVGSWYGRRFHGMPTSSGERYDMYAMTAAHPTLPIPSYARVTNPANGRSVVVRINDRGPFHSDRIIDLSYTAAWKLGYVEAGSARVEVESLLPGEAPAPAGQAKGAGRTARAAIFLQLGAFSAREAAENFRARLSRDLAWLSEAIQVVASGALFRLHLGPVPHAGRSALDRRPHPGGTQPAADDRRQVAAIIRGLFSPESACSRCSAFFCSLPLALAQAPQAPQLVGRAWVLADVSSGQILAAEKPDERFEPASLTKLMTAYLVFAALKEKKLTLEQQVTVSEKAWRAPGSRMFIEPQAPGHGGRADPRHDRAVGQRRLHRARRSASPAPRRPSPA